MDVPRPVFLKLSQIRLPIMALVSILHRVSGVILAIATPFLIYYLSVSLESANSYQELVSQASPTLFKLLLVITLWAFGHHIFAGFRLLLIDFFGRPVKGRDSARTVLVLSMVSFILAALVVFYR